MSELPDTPRSPGRESPLPVEDDSEPAPSAAPGTAVMPLTKDAIEKFLKFVPILPESFPARSCAGVFGAHTAWASRAPALPTSPRAATHISSRYCSRKPSLPPMRHRGPSHCANRRALSAPRVQLQV
jgi:hypothetical protein